MPSWMPKWSVMKKKPQAPRKEFKANSYFHLALYFGTTGHDTDSFLCSDFLCQLSQDSEPEGLQPLPGRPLRSHEKQRPQGWKQIPLGKQIPRIPAWPGEGTGPRCAPVHGVCFPITSPLSGQESHGRIWIEGHEGPHWRFPALWSPFTGWEADSMRWVPSSRWRRYMSSGPSPMQASTARLDRNIDRYTTVGHSSKTSARQRGWEGRHSKTS